MKKIATLTAAMMLTAGCTTNPYTGEQQVSKTVIGTGVGAAAGAAAGAIGGAIAGKPGTGAAIGAGIGALAGMGVGAYMDRQEAILRQKLAGTGVRVVREGDNLRLIMPGNITFATDSADIAAHFFPVLNSVAIVLKQFPETLIEVTGHTDSTGSAEYNQRLSEQRAQSVAQYLMAQGVAPNRVIARGMGESMPIASNATPEGRAQNRRVEIRIHPMTRH
ncbi:MAG: cell envelope biogenesis protein OmpA [Methylothermaceae bacteria B42]|nr:MAG: cell envelope biogenesis protein OmpA [Methylothermaceae bacteria B42]HHJ39691.1 OmpA family protein [Methylothermaceae bacterium]